MSIIHAARERKTLLCSFVRTGKSGYVLDGAFKPHLEKSLSLRACSLDLSGPVCEFPAFARSFTKSVRNFVAALHKVFEREMFVLHRSTGGWEK